MGILIQILLFTVILTVLLAKYNAHNIKLIECMTTKHWLIDTRNNEMRLWHLWQWIARGFVFAAVSWWLLGFTLEAGAVALLAGVLSWNIFDPLLNLFRGLNFFHKGVNFLDMIYRYEFTHFLMRIFLLLVATCLYYLVNVGIIVKFW